MIILKIESIELSIQVKLVFCHSLNPKIQLEIEFLDSVRLIKGGELLLLLGVLFPGVMYASHSICSVLWLGLAYLCSGVLFLGVGLDCFCVTNYLFGGYFGFVFCFCYYDVIFGARKMTGLIIAVVI